MSIINYEYYKFFVNTNNKSHKYHNLLFSHYIYHSSYHNHGDTDNMNDIFYYIIE